MAKPGELQYRVECIFCGRRFLVDSMSSKIPKHPPKGVTVEPYMPYVPYPGSGTVGAIIETVVKGFDNS